MVTEDVIEHPLNPGQPPGREALKQIFGGFSVLVPDLRITVEDIIADDDRAAVRSTVTGTPAGPYLGVNPAGRPMRFEAIDIWRTADGLVAEGWHIEDFVAALVDWGAVTFASRPEASRRRRPPKLRRTAPATSWMWWAAGIRHCGRLMSRSSARSPYPDPARVVVCVLSGAAAQLSAHRGRRDRTLRVTTAHPPRRDADSDHDAEADRPRR